MAGKVKNKDDGQVQSKTARASMRTGGGKEAYVASPDVSRIVPLGGGTHAYVLDPRDGRTIHVKVSSERFIEVLSELVDTSHGDRLRKELDELAERYPAFKDASDRLEAALSGDVGEEDAA